MTVLTFNRGLSSVVSKEMLSELTEVRNSIPKTTPWDADVADRFERLARIAKTAQLRSLRKVLITIARASKKLNTEPSDALLDATQKALQAVLTHLQELVQDHKNTPMKMAKPLQVLLQTLGDKVSPTLSAELYLPYIPEDTSPARPTELAAADFIGYVKEHRTAYQQSLVKLIKDNDVSQLSAMRQALLTLEPKNPNVGFRVFFEAAIAVFDRLIKTQQLDNVGKWIVGKIDPELSKIEGGQTKVDEDLLSVILYVVARAEPESGARMRILQDHFNLKSYLADGADSAVVEKFLGVLVKARELWTQNNNQDLSHMSKLVGELNSKAPLLKNAGFTHVINALNDVLVAVLNKTSEVDESQLALEGASALLVLEQQLREGPSMDMAHASASRLYGLIGKQVEALVSDGQTATVILHRLAAEVQEDLDQLEPKILEIFSGHSEAETEFKAGLIKVSKILRILGKDNPLAAVIVRFEQDFSVPEDTEAKAELATRYTQLGTLVDHLKNSEKTAFQAAQKWLDNLNVVADVEAPAVVENLDKSNDAEMLEIFLEEADSILIDLDKWIKALKHDHSDHEMLINIRRGYHTLKGSGRMVGLGYFGDLAYITELLLNNWIQTKKIPDNALIQFIDDSTSRVTKHIEDFKATGTSLVPFADMEERALALGGTPLSDAPQTKKATSKKLSPAPAKAVPAPVEVKPAAVETPVAPVEPVIELAPVEVPAVIEPELTLEPVTEPVVEAIELATTIEPPVEIAPVEVAAEPVVNIEFEPEPVVEDVKAEDVSFETVKTDTKADIVPELPDLPPLAISAPVEPMPAAIELAPVESEPTPTVVETAPLATFTLEDKPVKVETPIQLAPVEVAPKVEEPAPAPVIKPVEPIASEPVAPRRKRETPDAWKQGAAAKPKTEPVKVEPRVEPAPVVHNTPVAPPAPETVKPKGFFAKLGAFFAGLFGGKK